MEKKILELEKEKLNNTINMVEEILNDENKKLKELYEEYFDDKEELWRIAERKKIRINNLEFALDKPYFARIDFISDDGEKSIVYIGKNGIMKDSDIIVTDWRAPISSLYYDSEIGNCSFESPSGTIIGNMELKRQFEIENGILNDYFDVDLVSNDELLQKYLNSNNDARVKSIVSTIQKEQNDVIRKKINDNLIVQGVAGSGKTTVALHRIAYLVYNYIDSIKQNQYLVIGPNPVFLKYIKSVLPDLDVSGVDQCTFEQYAKNYLNEEFKINSSEKKVLNNIMGTNENNVDKFKSSIKYKDMLDQFLRTYLYSLTSKPLMINDFEILPQKTIEKVFNETNTEYFTSLNNRIEITIERLCKLIENNYSDISSKYSEYSFNLFKRATTEKEKNEMRMQFAKERAEIGKYCRSTLKKYFNKSKINAFKLYKLFIGTIESYNIHNYNQIQKLKSDTIKNIKNNSYDFEDLSAIIYIQSFISPNKDYAKIKHVVVDEAQDLGEFNFYVLKQTLPNATFSIFGDIAQSIYDYRGINNWDEVNKTMFNDNGKIIKFNKSYRTTAEIMSVADDVAEKLGLGRSELVVRHGDEVLITKSENENDIPKHIASKIHEYQKKGYKTIAVISKNDLLSNYINDDLAELGIKIPNVSSKDDLTDEKFRVCTISNQLAKGLEFDAVIINNAKEGIYSSNNDLDMKLLYVAITRALHELDIVYSDELTKVLQKRIDKKKVRKLTID